MPDRILPAESRCVASSVISKTVQLKFKSIWETLTEWDDSVGSGDRKSSKKVVSFEQIRERRPRNFPKVEGANDFLYQMSLHGPPDQRWAYLLIARYPKRDQAS